MSGVFFWDTVYNKTPANVASCPVWQQTSARAEWNFLAHMSHHVAGPTVWNSLPHHLQDPAVDPNNLGETWRRICSLDIRSISALEVLGNCALQIDIYLLAYLVVCHSGTATDQCEYHCPWVHRIHHWDTGSLYFTKCVYCQFLKSEYIAHQRLNFYFNVNSKTNNKTLHNREECTVSNVSPFSYRARLKVADIRRM